MNSLNDDSVSRISAILDSSVLAGRVRSVGRFEGSLSDRSILVQLDRDQFVLRRSLGRNRAISKELSVLQALRGVIPVPAVVDSDSEGQRTGEPFLVYEYLEGKTFQEIRTSFPKNVVADAAFLLGTVLGKLSAFQQPSTSWEEIGVFARRHPVLDIQLIRRYLDVQESTSIDLLFRRWQDRLREIYKCTSLVHGDFNNRNAIFGWHDGNWRLRGIIDWEHAFWGSSLWDVARFVCYEVRHSPCREPHFSNGFRAAGGSLPNDWHELSVVLTTINAAQALCREDLPLIFVDDLCSLARSGIETLGL